MLRIYYINIERKCTKEQYEKLYEMLPPERREQVNRAGNEEIAGKRLLCGAFLQKVLSQETGIPIHAIRYQYNAWGKPEIAGSCIPEGELPERIHFNLSHSGKYAVLAVSDIPVGVDVEHKRKNYQSLAKRFFCREEYEDIMAEDMESERQDRFLEYWTMKEAYIKYVGEGLRIPLNSFLIRREGAGKSTAKEQNVHFSTIFLKKSYCISVCSEKIDELALQNILFLTDL